MSGGDGSVSMESSPEADDEDDWLGAGVALMVVVVAMLVKVLV